MSLIKEHYQDADGNWLPEAQAILAEATAAMQATSNGNHTLLPINEVEDFFELLVRGAPLMQPEEEPSVGENPVGMRPGVRRGGLAEAELLIEFHGRADIGGLEADLVKVSEHARRSR